MLIKKKGYVEGNLKNKKQIYFNQEEMLNVAINKKDGNTALTWNRGSKNANGEECSMEYIFIEINGI